MFIMTKQAVLFHRPDGVKFTAPNGFMGSAPDWIGATRQFRQQVADGKIIVTESTKDAAVEKAAAEADKTIKKARAAAEKKAAEAEKTSDTAEA